MKKTLALLLAITIAIMATGCTTSKDDNPVIIKTATSFGGDSANAAQYQECLADFMKANATITVQDNSRKADDNWKSEIRSKFQAGGEDDVMFFFAAADAKAIIEKDQVVSIEEIRETYPDYCKNIKQEAINNLREYDGNTYAMPIMGFWEGLYCNEELFKENNIPMITDWDSLIFAINAFKAKGIAPIAASFFDIPNYWIEHVILSAGGVSAHSVNPKVASDIPAEWDEGFAVLSELYDMAAFQSDSLNTKHELAVQLYNAGEAAMILEGSWLGLSPETEKVSRVVRFPSADAIGKSEQGVISGFSMGFYITRKAWNDKTKRDACVKYVEFMSSNDSIQKLCIQGAPAADIIADDDDSKIKKDGINICKESKMQMPIDSRISKAAWEYLTGKTAAVLDAKLTSKEVLDKAITMNN